MATQATPAPLQVESQLCFRLYATSRLAQGFYTQYFKEHNITYTQYLVLCVLWEKDHCIVSDITNALMLETNTITPLLQRMEKQHLVRRKQGKEDTRQRIISLTKKGRELKEVMRDLPEKMLEYLTNDCLSADELTAFTQTLEKIIAHKS